jgi:hypothetical protein
MQSRRSFVKSAIRGHECPHAAMIDPASSLQDRAWPARVDLMSLAM